jgi:hypothetical protein
MIFAVLAVVGWILILYVNQWHLGVPAVMLCLGWVALLAVGRFLWQAGVSAAVEGERGDDEGFDIAPTRRDELMREKRVLLKALKELEFDHQMGKLSAVDAETIRQLYRGRAIDIIKQLETMGEGETAGADDAASIRDEIDRELRARLDVLEAQHKGAAEARSEKKKKSKKAATKGKAKGKPGPDADADAGEEG